MEPIPQKIQKIALKYGLTHEVAIRARELKTLLVQASTSDLRVSDQILQILSTDTEIPLVRILDGSFLEILNIPPVQNSVLVEALFQQMDFSKEPERITNFAGVFNKTKGHLSLQDLIEELKVYFKVAPREIIVKSVLRILRQKVNEREIANFPATNYYVNQLYKFIFDYLTDEEKLLFHEEVHVFSVRYQTQCKVERSINQEDVELEFLASISPETNQLYQRIKQQYYRNELHPEDLEAVYALLEYIPTSRFLQKVVSKLILNNTEIEKHLSQSHPLDWQVICHDYSLKGFHQVPIVKNEILDPEDFLDLCTFNHILDNKGTFDQLKLQTLIAKYPHSQAIKFVKVKFLIQNGQSELAKSLARSCPLLAKNIHVLSQINSPTN